MKETKQRERRDNRTEPCLSLFARPKEIPPLRPAGAQFGEEEEGQVASASPLIALSALKTVCARQQMPLSIWFRGRKSTTQIHTSTILCFPPSGQFSRQNIFVGGFARICPKYPPNPISLPDISTSYQGQEISLERERYRDRERGARNSTSTLRTADHTWT